MRDDRALVVVFPGVAVRQAPAVIWAEQLGVNALWIDEKCLDSHFMSILKRIKLLINPIKPGVDMWTLITLTIYAGPEFYTIEAADAIGF